MSLPKPADYSFARYLAAKKSVDDRALNRHVWASLVKTVPASTPVAGLRVLEIGAGIGTMLERLIDWGLLTHAAYTGIDAEPDNIEEAQRRLPTWAVGQDFTVKGSQEGMCLQRGKQQVFVELAAVDLFDFVAQERQSGDWDLVVAHAFMDLMHVPTTLPSLFSLLRPGGLFYATIVFDGATILQPEIDPELDAKIEMLYHRTMDLRVVAGRPSGDSQAGRHLLSQLQAAGAEVLDVGSSDWVVFAKPNGYPADEAYFLHFIIHTIHAALDGHPDLDAARFADWVALRHAQVRDGRLVYIAHQLDYLARVPAPSVEKR
jgi:SAM-dependent methyltransferase